MSPAQILSDLRAQLIADGMRAVLIKRVGLGWRVGLGPLETEEIDDDRGAYLLEREATKAALQLADELGMLLVLP